jgi:hypothetical protein
MVGRKLYSLTMELYAIRTLTVAPESRAAQELLAKLDESYFATEVARTAFKVCLKSLRRKSELPDWEDLITDPAIDESIRDALAECDLKPVNNKKKTMKLIQRLGDYRRWRLLAKIGKISAKFIESTEDINIDDAFAEVSNVMNQQSSGKNFRVLRIGKNSNSLKYVKKVLKGEAITYVPTGFKGFDSINRGLPPGFHLMASPTGRGKSTMLNQIAQNMAEAGAKVGFAPLEMSNEENLQRNIARVAQIDMTRLLDPQNKISNTDYEEILERWEKHDKKIEKNGGAIEFYEFDNAVTAESLAVSVQSFGLDVLIIDYLGLLDETSGDAQWQKLGEAAWFLHTWAKANGVVVIAAAQLSEEGALRYSKMLAEHAKFFWYWAPDDTARASGIYKITQRKARNASDHDFYLKFDLPRMTVVDAESDDVDEAKKQEKDSKSPRDASKTSKKWEKDSSVGWGDEEDIPDPVPGKRAQHDKKSKNGKRRTPQKEVEL